MIIMNLIQYSLETKKARIVLYFIKVTQEKEGDKMIIKMKNRFKFLYKIFIVALNLYLYLFQFTLKVNHLKMSKIYTVISLFRNLQIILLNIKFNPKMTNKMLLVLFLLNCLEYKILYGE